MGLIFNDIEKLYTYNNGYKTVKTNTFDYNKFRPDDKVARKVMLLLLLAQQSQIDTNEVKMKDLIERCKRIIENADSNYETIHDYLKTYESIYKWLCQA